MKLSKFAKNRLLAFASVITASAVAISTASAAVIGVIPAAEVASVVPDVIMVGEAIVTVGATVYAFRVIKRML